MENVSLKHKVTLPQVFHDYYFSFMFRNTNEVFFNGIPRTVLKLKIENEKFTVGDSRLFFVVALLQNTSRKFTKMRVARVSRLFVLLRPIVLLYFVVPVDVTVVFA